MSQDLNIELACLSQSSQQPVKQVLQVKVISPVKCPRFTGETTGAQRD